MRNEILIPDYDLPNSPAHALSAYPNPVLVVFLTGNGWQPSEQPRHTHFLCRQLRRTPARRWATPHPWENLPLQQRCMYSECMSLYHAAVQTSGHDFVQHIGYIICSAVLFCCFRHQIVRRESKLRHEIIGKRTLSALCSQLIAFRPTGQNVFAKRDDGLDFFFEF